MLLTKIVARNVKGQSFEIPLSQAVAIIGPNFAGKSAVIEAIRLLFIGHIPEIGKLPSATWELSSGGDMEIEGHFDNGATLMRRFWLEGGKVKSGYHGVETDPSFFEGIPLMDAEHYFSLTDTQRTDYVFDRIRLPDTYSSAAIIAGIQQISLGEEHSEHVEEAKRKLIQVLHEFFVGDAPIQDALGKSVESLREKYSYWNKRKTETQGAVTTLTELKVREKQFTAAPVKLDQEMQKASAELDRINTEKGRGTAERDAAERNAGRRTMLQKELDKDRIDYPRMLSQKQEEKQALEKQLVPEPKPEEIEEARRTIAGATSTMRGADNAVNVSDIAIGEVETRLKEIAKLKECPYCKTKGTGWKKTLEAELNERKTKAVEDIKTATKLRDKANEELRDANETLDALIQAQGSNERLREQIRTIREDIAVIQANQRSEKEKRERYEAEIKEMPKSDVKKLNQQIADLEKERLAIAQKLSELNGRKTAETRLQQDLLRAGEAEQEHLVAKANLAVVKAVAQYLKDKKEAIICEAFTKLLQVANTLVKSILKTPLVLHENTIGRFDGAKFVPHRTFSGTEKALAYLAIALALSQESPCKLVMLDEFGRLDPANQANVTARLLNLVRENIIDQFILVGTHVAPGLVEGGALQIVKVES